MNKFLNRLVGCLTIVSVTTSVGMGMDTKMEDEKRTTLSPSQSIPDEKFLQDNVNEVKDDEQTLKQARKYALYLLSQQRDQIEKGKKASRFNLKQKTTKLNGYRKK
jgi:hypothetical protein